MVKAIRFMYSVVVLTAAFLVLMTIGCMLVGILKHFGVDDAITYTWYGGILGFGSSEMSTLHDRFRKQIDAPLNWILGKIGKELAVEIKQ